MNKKFLSLCLFNFKTMKLNITLFFLFLLSTTSIYVALTYDSTQIKEFNMWNFYSVMFTGGPLVSALLFFYNLFLLFHCFQSEKDSLFLKIRSGNSLLWFFSKIISIFLLNIIAITIATIIILLIGWLFWGFGNIWGGVNIHNSTSYKAFYSPIKIVIFNIATYSFFITFLSEIVGYLMTKLKNKFIVIFLFILYFMADKTVNLKYFSFDKYTDLNCRCYYLYLNSNNYFTIKEGIFIPILLTVIFSLIFILLYFIKRFYLKRNLKV
ncbi:hypothetical protein Q6375_14480 [Clostridium septicum]|uniref:hypothetical protein n=1 Tax=Clostridium septicum TaxID=1504 RepID=UPI00272E9A32|nr:hypothetical protein [Clostridium septicum]WLF69165.1 hypothetical protein Q6375_14480 [Clostridium septicum]